MSGFTCEFCAEVLESAATKHTLLDCSYHLKLRNGFSGATTEELIRVMRGRP